MKKVLFITNYFYPEVASIAQLYTELCENMMDQFQMTVVCAVPCYSGKIDASYQKKRFFYEKYQNIKIIRVHVAEFQKTNKLSRIKHIVSYFFNTILAILKAEKPDIIFTCSQPPILGGLLGVIAKRLRNGKLIYNIQDFNPEQTEAVGYSKNKFVLTAAKFLDNHSCKCSDLVITVGRDMQETLCNRFRGKKVPKNIVINNWIDESQIYPLPANQDDVLQFKKQYGLDGKFVIMYSGNIGLFYDLENMIKVIGKFKNRADVVFAFVGDGAVKPILMTYVTQNKIKNVTFIPYQDKSALIYSLNAADVHLVLNAKGIKGVSVPSKIYGILAVNKPIFGVLEPGSEAWNIIDKSGCGILCKAGDYVSIEKNLNDLIDRKESFINRHSTGHAYLMERFTKDKSIERYKNAIENL